MYRMGAKFVEWKSSMQFWWHCFMIPKFDPQTNIGTLQLPPNSMQIHCRFCNSQSNIKATHNPWSNPLKPLLQAKVTRICWIHPNRPPQRLNSPHHIFHFHPKAIYSHEQHMNSDTWTVKTPLYLQPWTPHPLLHLKSHQTKSLANTHSNNKQSRSP
jgi:hypothetical protein